MIVTIPQKAEHISAVLLNHEAVEHLLYVSYYCNWTCSESHKNSKEAVVKVFVVTSSLWGGNFCSIVGELVTFNKCGK
ncbi:hypothetical protein GOODEAATRI_031332 [Goodea atripinnis]|uniref:Uncharacterized protein n=1 Tax=Goodea atripinnis TaxID=208336 RepID=A0ABV0MWN3_9TELE